MQQGSKQNKKKVFFVALKYVIIAPSSLFQRFFFLSSSLDDGHFICEKMFPFFWLPLLQPVDGKISRKKYKINSEKKERPPKEFICFRSRVFFFFPKDFFFLHFLFRSPAVTSILEFFQFFFLF